MPEKTWTCTAICTGCELILAVIPHVDDRMRKPKYRNDLEYGVQKLIPVFKHDDCFAGGIKLRWRSETGGNSGA